jgi:hypothetical protein
LGLLSLSEESLRNCRDHGENLNMKPPRSHPASVPLRKIGNQILDAAFSSTGPKKLSEKSKNRNSTADGRRWT